MVNNSNLRQNIIISNKEMCEIDGAKNVLSFSEDYLEIDTTHGRIGIEGEELKIEELRQDVSKVNIRGKISGVFYITEKIRSGFFKKK